MEYNFTQVVGGQYVGKGGDYVEMINPAVDIESLDNEIEPKDSDNETNAVPTRICTQGGCALQNAIGCFAPSCRTLK